jgi:hypothetical protein
MTRPDFSPEMLRFFLFARAIARDGFDQTIAGRTAARADLMQEIMAQSGLAWSDVKAAFAGTLDEPGKRAAIWAALGHFPADYGMVLATRQERGIYP